MIRDPFQHRRHLCHRHNKAKVARGWLSQSNHIDRAPIDVDLHLIDGVVVSQNVASLAGVPFSQRTHRTPQRGFGFATQTQNCVTQRVQFLVKVSMNFCAHPNLPVM